MLEFRGDKPLKITFQEQLDVKAWVVRGRRKIAF